MNYIRRIEKILNEQNGTLLSLDLDKYNIPRTYLSTMGAEGKIERIGRGIYVLPNALEDEMDIMQKKYPNLVYSHETALFSMKYLIEHPLNILQQYPADIK
mgnify:CR=1 FL=1